MLEGFANCFETNWAELGVARVGPLCDGWRDFHIDCTQEFGVECRNQLKKYCRVVNMGEVVAAVSSQNICSHFFVEGTKPAVGATKEFGLWETTPFFS